jgi:hypothetical protein
VESDSKDIFGGGFICRFAATVINVMIASPGDVDDQRQAARKIVHE